MKWNKNKGIGGINGWAAGPSKRRVCAMSGKTVFDKRGAQTAANKRWDEDHVRLRIYPCSCGGWHLTSRL